MEGGVHAFDLASEAVWALVWERLGADKAAKRALAETSRALHDLALGLWHAVVFGPYAKAYMKSAVAFANRLRSPNIILTIECDKVDMQRDTSLHALLAAMDDGAAGRVTALYERGRHEMADGHLQQLSRFTNLHTLVWNSAAGSDPAKEAAGLAALPPSLTALDVNVVRRGAGSGAGGLGGDAALNSIGAAAALGGLAGLQRLTARQLQPGELWQLAPLTALCELSLPGVCGTLDDAMLQQLQQLSQLTRLQALCMPGVLCPVNSLAALACVQPWTKLELLGLYDEEGGDAGEYTFPALRTFALHAPIWLQHVELLAAHCPLLAEVVSKGVTNSVRMDMPDAATAAKVAAELRKLQRLHDRQLLRSVELHLGAPIMPPMAVLLQAAAQLGPLALPSVEELQVVDVYASSCFTDQHLRWLLGLLPSVRVLKLKACSQLTGACVLAALLLHRQRQQQLCGDRAPPMRLELSYDLRGFRWDGLCAWAAALPAGQHALLEIAIFNVSFEDVSIISRRGGQLACKTLTHMLRLAGRGYVTVRWNEDGDD